MTGALTIACTVAAQAALPTSSIGANNEICTATSVLNEIDLRNRKGLEKILNDAANVANNGAVLWRIEKAGVPQSYLFGTVHIIDNSLQELSPKVRSAIDQSKVIAIETAEISHRAYASAMAEAGPLMISTDKDLQGILDNDELTVVEKAISAAGYAPQLALGLKPWAATLFLAGSECQKNLQNRGMKSVDELVTDRAAANGQKIVGLETMLDQYRSLASIPKDAQAAWLRSSVALYPRVDDIAFTMAELYRFRRLDAVWPLTQEMAPGTGLDDATLKTLKSELVTKRNSRMLERALPLIDQGGAFIAVGAVHQTGPDGLVELLRRNGLTVTPVE